MNRLVTALAIVLLAPAAATAKSPAGRFMPGAVSGPANDYNLSVSDDGRTMVFARSEADFAKAKIMVSERGRGPGSRWSPPRRIAFSDERFRDSDPWLTPDGRTLYLVSDRPTGARPDKRDLDVWRSVKRGGVWQTPEHLGEEVNGPGEELGPEMHGDTLYFATALRSGVGGLDIYAAKVTRDGFAKRELAPGPFNTGASESDFTLSRDGATALFWRTVGARGLIHLSRRGSDGRWSDPRPLPDSVNIGAFNFTPAFSADGKRITFASDAPQPGQPAGLADVYEAVLE